MKKEGTYVFILFEWDVGIRLYFFRPIHFEDPTWL